MAASSTRTSVRRRADAVPGTGQGNAGADGATFAHDHAEVTDDRGRPVFAVPGQTFGPELAVHARAGA